MGNQSRRKRDVGKVVIDTTVTVQKSRESTGNAVREWQGKQ